MEIDKLNENSVESDDSDGEKLEQQPSIDKISTKKLTKMLSKVDEIKEILFTAG